MQQWEYFYARANRNMDLVIEIDGSAAPGPGDFPTTISEFLNNSGVEGWELCGVTFIKVT